jgi:hypothetical protein
MQLGSYDLRGEMLQNPLYPNHRLCPWKNCIIAYSPIIPISENLEEEIPSGDHADMRLAIRSYETENNAIASS